MSSMPKPRLSLPPGGSPGGSIDGPGPRSRAGRGGQAAVLAALCLFTMVVFVALATNVGMLASDRIRIQNAADASALAGAYAQAGRMNQVAALNANIAYTAWYCRMRLTWQPGTSTPRRWNQCSPEAQTGDFPFHPPFGSGPAVDPPGGPGAGIETPICYWNGGTPTGYDWDPDAEALIDWCQESIHHYHQLIASVNNYTVNYRRAAPLVKGGGVRRAAYLTADANFFKSGNELSASRNTYIYDDVPSDRSNAYSPTWRDDLQNRPQGIPRFQMPIPSTGNPDDTPPMRWIPSLVDLDIAISRFGYFVEYCDSAWEQPRGVCGPRDQGRVHMAHAIKGRSLFTWYGKRTYPNAGRDTTYSVFFPVKIFGTPIRRFLDLDDLDGGGYFGGTSNAATTDQLSAYAAAKPYDGLIGPNRLIGDDRFTANYDVINEPVMYPSPISTQVVYSAEAIRDLIEDDYFGATISFGMGGISATPQNQYRARLMGMREEPIGRVGTGALARPVETVERAIELRKEPGAPDKLPSPGWIKSQLLH